MFYLTSDFSVLSVSTSRPGYFSLSVVDVASGDTVFSNSYYIPGISGRSLSITVRGIGDVILDDLVSRGDYCRDYSVSVAPLEGSAPPLLSLPYGPPAGSSLTASFIADAGGQAYPGWPTGSNGIQTASGLLQLSPLIQQSEFNLVNLPSSHPFYPLLSTLQLTLYADGGSQTSSGFAGNYLRTLSFFNSQAPIEDASYISPGWRTLSLYPSSSAPLRLVAIDASPSVAAAPVSPSSGVRPPAKVLSVSTLSVDSFSGLVLFQFRNRFNIMEPMLLRGAITVSPKADSQSISVYGASRRVDVRRKDQYTFSVEGLTPERASEISGLLYSGLVKVFVPDSVLIPAASRAPVEIVVDSVEGEIAQSAESLSSVKISFSLL